VTLATAHIPSHNHAGNTDYFSSNHTHNGTSGTVNSNHTHGFGDPGHGHNVRYSRGWLQQGPVNPSQTSNPNAVLDYATYGAGTGTYTGGSSADHYHYWASGGSSADHNHQVYAEGGGGAHLNTGPTIIVNKIVRAL
jgi:hypothetical protein